MNLTMIFIIINVINALILTYAMTNMILYPIKRANKVFVFLYLAFCLAGLGNYFGQEVTLFTFGGAMLIIAASERHFISNAIFSLAGYLLAVLFNHIVMVPFNLLGITITHMSYSFLYSLLFITLYGIFTFIITYFMGKILRLKFMNSFLFISKRAQLLLFLEAITCFVIFAINIVQGEKEGYPPEIIYFNTILFGIFFVITLFILFFCIRILENNQKLQTEQQKQLDMEEYMQKLEDSYQDMRIFKHDYVNLLSTMQLLIDEDEADKLKNLFYTRILPSSQKLAGKDAIIGKLSNIKLIELKGILYSKILSAMNQDINITLEIQEEIHDLSMEMLDLVTVIGIFMDNAIEAALVTEDKHMTVIIIDNEVSVTIIISNSAPDIDINLDEIYHRDITYKKNHSGLGLYSAITILNKYNNTIHSTTYNNNIFTQSLEICKTP